MADIHTPEVRTSTVGRFIHMVWVTIEYLAVHFFEACGENIRIMRRELDLFLGTILFLLGLFNFSSGKYCDGNTADYLSCTRPTTYYYYSGFAVLLIVVGVSLVLVWYVKNRTTK